MSLAGVIIAGGKSSRMGLEKAFLEIARRPVPDVMVIGHTDTVGSDSANDAIALRRAEMIRSQLVERGVPAANILAIGRGKRELLVQTPDLSIEDPRKGKIVTRRAPTNSEMDALTFGIKVCKHIKSNAIAFVVADRTLQLFDRAVLKPFGCWAGWLVQVPVDKLGRTFAGHWIAPNNT